MEGEPHLEVTLSHDLRHHIRRNWKMDREEVAHLYKTGEKELAYSIDANRSYKLNLQSDVRSCANEQWFFRLKRGIETCEDQEVHERIQGKPRLRITTDLSTMVSRSLDAKLQFEGGDHTKSSTIEVEVNETTGCKVCDAFFVLVSYNPCCGDSDYEMHLPIVLKHDN
jgi:hypothetical protein